MLYCAGDHARGIGQRQARRRDDHHREGHDRDHIGRRSAQRPARKQAPLGLRARKEKRVHRTCAVPSGGLRRLPVGSVSEPFSSRISCAPGRAGDQPNVVGRDHNGRAEPVQRREQVEKTRRHFGIDVSGRLVGDKQLRLADDRPRNRYALLLAARQGGRARARPVGEPDPGKHFPHRSFKLGIALARDPQGQRDIVERRKMADQAEVLEDDADPAVDNREGRRAKRRSGPARTAGSDLGSVGERGREAAEVTSCLHRTGRSGNRSRPLRAGNRGREGPRHPCRNANQHCRIRR